MINDPRANSQEDAFDLPPEQAGRKKRYFFDVHDGEVSTIDDTGLELDGLEAAQNEAVRCLPGLATDALPDGTERTFTVVVREEGGEPVLKASLSLVVERLGRV